MSNGAAALLRLLEPAVRPVGLPAGSPTRAPAAPFESRSFESLLSEFGTPPPASAFSSGSGPEAAPVGTPVAENEPAGRPEAPSPLAPLGGVDRIENPTLRDLLARPAA